MLCIFLVFSCCKAPYNVVFKAAQFLLIIMVVVAPVSLAKQGALGLMVTTTTSGLYADMS